MKAGMYFVPQLLGLNKDKDEEFHRNKLYKI